MGRTLLMWKEPTAVRRLSRSRDRWDFLIHVIGILAPTALTTHFILSRDFAWLFADIVMIIVYVLWICLGIPAYKIEEKGISYTDGSRRLHCRWNEIEWYWVKPMDAVPGINEVFFHTTSKRLKYLPIFVFDPQEVDEAALRRILEEYLPQRKFEEWWTQNHAFNGPRI